MLKVALFILGVTGYAVSNSEGKGGKMNMPDGFGGSQFFSRPSGRMTGIRSWIGRMSSFAAVVRMAKVTVVFSASPNL